MTNDMTEAQAPDWVLCVYKYSNRVYQYITIVIQMEDSGYLGVHRSAPCRNF